MSVPSTTPAVAAAKTALRSQHLRELRSWPKTHPRERQLMSQTLCDKLFAHVTSKYLLPPQSSTTTVSSAQAVRSGSLSLYICSYLPLYYEVDVLPFTKELWAFRDRMQERALRAQGGGDALPQVVMLIPFVVQPHYRRTGKCAGGTATTAETDRSAVEYLQPLKEWHEPHSTVLDRLGSAMVFVEVRDEADLQTSLEVKKQFNVQELKDAVFLEFFQRRHDNEEGEKAKEKTAAATSTTAAALPPRRILCCDEWERLFPMHKAPPGLLRLPTPTNCPRGEGGCVMRGSLVVLAPGVCFSRTTGARLGKGGGFYDRFLTHLYRSAVVGAEGGGGAQQQEASGGGECLHVEVLGVAFDTQVTDRELAADAAVDAPMGGLATPQGGVERVLTPYWRW